MIRTAPTLAEQSVARVKEWLAAEKARRVQIAKEAGIDEKTIRLSIAENWDPRASTLRKLEAIMPCPAPKTKRREPA